MKHIRFFVVVSVMSLLLVGMTGCKDKHKIVEPKEGPAHLVIQPTTCNLGFVSQGAGVVVKEFAMINDGSEDLEITGIENLCSCTSADYVDKPIAPGHGRTLRVALDTGHLVPGEFSRTVVVHSNGGDVSIDLTGIMKN